MKTTILILILIYNLNADYSALLFNGNCVTCHSVNDLNKSAPTILEIKQRYKEVFPVKEDFIKYMSSWVYKPNETTSIMQDAIKKYKLMPDLAYDKETLIEISEYIYSNDFR